MNAKIFCTLLIVMLSSIVLNAQRVGINTPTPQNTLDVRGSMRFGDDNKFLRFDSTGKFEWIGASLFVPDSQQIISHSAAAEGLYAGGGKLQYKNHLGNPVFFTDWSTGNGYFSGNVGIGIINPATKFHVFRGSSGTIPFDFSPLVVESNSHTYINLLSPSAYETAILFGQPGQPGQNANSANGVIMYNNTATPNGFQFRTNGNSTKMIINNSGNVGIGTIGPTEKLEVAGAAKASQYKFSTPRVSYYSIDPTAFTAATSSAVVERLFGQGAYISDGGFVELVVPLNLPHNASIISITADIYDNSATQDLQVVLSRRNATQSRLYLGAVLSTGNSGLSSYSFTTGAPEIIDNVQYSYLFEIFPTTSSWPTNGDLRIKKIVIAFSVAEAQ